MNQHPLVRSEETKTEMPDETKLISALQRKQEQYFLEKRSIFLWESIDESSAKSITNKLLLLDFDKPQTPITFYINSPGGVVTHGMVIYDTMQMISSPVYTICMGLAASMASLILAGGAKGQRSIYPNAEVMIHQPLLSGHMRAVSKDLEIEAAQMEKTKHLVSSIIAQHSNHNIVRVLKDIDRNYWLDPQEALEYGIVDKVIDKL